MNSYVVTVKKTHMSIEARDEHDAIDKGRERAIDLLIRGFIELEVHPLRPNGDKEE